MSGELEARDVSDFVRDRITELLAPFAPLARFRPRRPDDPELLEFAGVSRNALYRLIGSSAIKCERAPAPPRKDGRRGAARIFVTLADVAAWRSARFISVNEKAAGETAATKGTNERTEHRLRAHARQAATPS